MNGAMNGKEILVDSNILIYLLSGNKFIAEELESAKVFLSFITEVELLSYSKLSKAGETRIKTMFEELNIIPYSESIKATTIELRRKYSLKLPDAFIAATAFENHLPLYTADAELGKVNEIVTIIFQP
jgi:predicted nucleic acid-binding protein